MNRVKNQAGFTLIELVVVIVILGILAATAAPRFINIAGDARQSVMEGVNGSIQSAVTLAHSKALIDSQTGPTGQIQIGGTFYALVNGYPAAANAGNGNGTSNNGLGIAGLVDIQANGDVTVTNATPAIFRHARASTPASCQLSYANAVNLETRPVVTPTLSTAGCN